MVLNNEWINNEIKNNQKIHYNKWRREHNNSKPMGHSESRPEREIHSPTGLPQETRKSSKKQSNFTLKGTCKRITSKAQKWVERSEQK